MWSSGVLGGGPPTGATEKERRALFEEWLAANMDALRNAWDRTEVIHAEGWLHEAMAVALTYQFDHHDFRGLTPGEAEGIDPSLEFNVSETVFGVVSIRNPTQGSIVLTTESGSGQVLCIAWDTTRSKHDSYGTTDAHTVAECDGGGWLE